MEFNKLSNRVKRVKTGLQMNVKAFIPSAQQR